MERLITVLERMDDMDWLLDELKACDREIETVDDLADYLEDELECLD